MARNGELIAEQRNYAVLTVADAKVITRRWLAKMHINHSIEFGLPEIDDRYHVWRVPLIHQESSGKIGECVINAQTSNVQVSRSTKPEILKNRLEQRKSFPECKKSKNRKKEYRISPLSNTVGLGDSEELLKNMPDETVDLMFTSPPYFNARVEYDDYHSYDEYLDKIKRVLKEVHRVLGEGRFAVINVSPILLRRAKRSESSRRVAVPFDMHQLFIEIGFDFMEDIIWEKPEGAGWAMGRGRRFAADRNPLQYKAVIVTEYILVYRKRTDILIDWHIRNHPDQETVKKSKIANGYEKTNIWRIHPANRPEHPAVFPVELAQKVIQYYSFTNDVVLDPFAGVGTVAEAAIRLKRRFVLLEQNSDYVEVIKRDLQKFLGKKVEDVNWINCEPAETPSVLF